MQQACERRGERLARRWIDFRWKLVPNLDHVSVEIPGEEVGLAGHEFALLDDHTAGFSDGRRGAIDI
jgi:hypothetical protein